MPNSQICMPWVLYLFYEEVCQTRKAKQAQPRSSQIGAEFSSTVLNASTFLRSKTKKPFMKHSHKIQQSIDLTRPPQPYYNEKAVFTKGMGRSDVYLSAQSFVLMHISYMLLRLHVGSAVNKSADNTNISAATTFANSVLLWFPYHYRVSSAMASLPFQEPLTAGLRLFSHNHVSNCQQEAILKSHLSKILCTYGSEGNLLRESRERSLARTFKMG